MNAQIQTTHYNDPELRFQILEDPKHEPYSEGGHKITFPVQLTQETRSFKYKVAVKFDNNGEEANHVRHVTLTRPENDPTDGTALGPFRVGEVIETALVVGLRNKQKQWLPLTAIHVEGEK